MAISNDVSGGISGPTQLAEQAASTLVGGPVGAVVGPLLGGLLQGPAKSLFSELPLAFKGLFNAIQPGSQFPFQTMALPFSPAASDIPSTFFNNPSQLATNLTSASAKLGSGLNGIDLSGISTRQEAADTAQSTAAANPDNMTDQLNAQEALIKLQTAVNGASTEMNVLAEMAKKATDNSRLQ